MSIKTIFKRVVWTQHIRIYSGDMDAVPWTDLCASDVSIADILQGFTFVLTNERSECKDCKDVLSRMLANSAKIEHLERIEWERA